MEEKKKETKKHRGDSSSISILVRAKRLNISSIEWNKKKRSTRRKKGRKEQKNTEEDFCSISILARAKYLFDSEDEKERRKKGRKEQKKTEEISVRFPFHILARKALNIYSSSSQRIKLERNDRGRRKEERKKEKKRKISSSISILHFSTSEISTRFRWKIKKKRSTRWKKGAEKDRGRFLLQFRFHILARAKSIKYLFELENKTRKKRSTKWKKRRKKEREKHRRRFSF